MAWRCPTCPFGPRIPAGSRYAVVQPFAPPPLLGWGLKGDSGDGCSTSSKLAGGWRTRAAINWTGARSLIGRGRQPSPTPRPGDRKEMSVDLVIVESPYAGDVDANVAYARAAVRDCLDRGEAPIASHLLYTQPGILRDDDPEERQWGIDAGLAWRAVAHKAVFYADRGWSRGMTAAREIYEREGKPFEVRTLSPTP